MIDKEKIPEQAYKELITLFGKEEADKIIIKSRYNYYGISIILFEEKIVRYFGATKFQNWIKKRTRLSLVQFVCILILVGFLVYIFWPILFY